MSPSPAGYRPFTRVSRTPVHSVARTLATLEALIGQLYPSILIARLVSQDVTARR